MARAKMTQAQKRAAKSARIYAELRRARLQFGEVFEDLDDIEFDVANDENRRASAAAEREVLLRQQAVKVAAGIASENRARQQQNERKEEKEEKHHPPPTVSRYTRVGVAPDLPKPFNKGLFARVKIPAKIICAQYGGRIVTEAEADAGDSKYLTTDDAGNIWDGDPKTGNAGIAVFANDNRNRFGYNAQLVTYKGKVAIQADRDIEPGEEILVDYGPNYWSEQAPKAAQKKAQKKADRLPIKKAAPKLVAKNPLRLKLVKRGPRMGWDDAGVRRPAWKIAQDRMIERKFGGSIPRWKAHRAQQRKDQRARKKARENANIAV